jgi:hypothetical protein
MYIHRHIYIHIYIQREWSKAEGILITVNDEKEELRTRLQVHEEKDIEIENLKLVNMKVEKDCKDLELGLRRAEEEKEELKMRLQVYEERDIEIENLKLIHMKLQKKKESDDDLIKYEQLKWSSMHVNEVKDLISSLKGK